VILPGTRSTAKRSVRLGWVVDFDDESRLFLILFGENAPKYETAAAEDAPFSLTGGTPWKGEGEDAAGSTTL